jgi:ribonuclease HII
MFELMENEWEGRLADPVWRRLRRCSPDLVAAFEPERRRLSRMARHEREARRQGSTVVAGLDEVGRGPLAGPLVAAAVVFDDHPWIVGLNDSKQLLPEEREALRDRILLCARTWAIGQVTVEEMKQGLNMHVVNLLALERARDGLACAPDLLLIDGRFGLRRDENQRTLVKGDCRSYSIAAASIVAKVYRDKLMKRLHETYPQYGFDSHKGYATPDHLEALKKHGPCPAHRPQFRSVREAMACTV